jgi:hypothetical protein
MVASPDRPVAVSTPPVLADLAAAPGELVASCQDCHHNMIMPVAALLSRYAAETLFPDIWGGFRCSAYRSKWVDVRPNWAACQAAGQISRS